MSEADDEDDGEPVVASAAGYDFTQRLLYRDALMLILDKPAGLPVHAGPRTRGCGSGATAEQSRQDDHLGKYLDSLRFGLPRLPQLAHRLDRDTSGCLVLGRHAEALRRLGKLFAQGRVTKEYWALVQGAPPQAQGRITAPLLRLQGSQAGAGYHMVVDAAGQEAVTDYWLEAQKDGVSWLRLQPQTGRTHQLRVHCAHLGCPILGDRKYGVPPHTVPLMLHAWRITVPLYPKKDPITATAEPPAVMAALLAAMR